MDCSKLARRIEALLPGAAPAEVGRWCVVLLNMAEPDPSRLDCEEGFAALWNEAAIRVNAAHDQHDATLAELDDLARSDPRQFSPEQIWILVRALKVQSQLLQLYTRQGQKQINA